MAIDRIPGVGPTNADIATAVAAPSAATIATQVAASVPTRAQIQTDITNLGNTYNGPSAATIASTVASSVPTLAQITSAGNTAGWGSTGGETWTVISTPTIANSGTTTFSGLSGYKYYKIEFDVTLNGSSQIQVRINGNSTGNYDSYGQAGSSNSSSNAQSQWSLGFSSTNHVGYIISNNANVTGVKCWQWAMGNQGQGFYTGVAGHRTITDPITSIQVFSSSFNFSNNGITLYGGN